MEKYFLLKVIFLLYLFILYNKINEDKSK